MTRKNHEIPFPHDTDRKGEGRQDELPDIADILQVALEREGDMANDHSCEAETPETIKSTELVRGEGRAAGGGGQGGFPVPLTETRETLVGVDQGAVLHEPVRAAGGGQVDGFVRMSFRTRASRASRSGGGGGCSSLLPPAPHPSFRVVRRNLVRLLWIQTGEG